MRWLSGQARLGLRELPTNAAWLLSRAVQQPADAAGSAAAGTRDKARQLGASLVDAAPVGDSVETRMKRARAAAERAQEAEREARDAAQTAKECSDQAQQLAESNRAWLTEVERDANRRVRERVAAAQRAAEERVAEAKRAAEEQVARERGAALHEAEEKLEKVKSEATEETEAAQRDAEAAQQRADELVAASRERVVEARQLADEAVQAARAAAEEAQRQAQQLVQDAEQQAKDADAKAAAAEQLREDAIVNTRRTVARLQREQTDGNLESKNKAELHELAAVMEIEGHTKMSKEELISAITNAARSAR